MNKSLPLAENSIHDIFLDTGSSHTFQIPIYQRNYAWDEDQIFELVKDVRDSMANHPGSPYYIGTLVTYKREEESYEVIDGQQRLTTLFLILKALGDRLGDDTLLLISNKLTYRSRENSARTLRTLPALPEDYDRKIKEGYDLACGALDEYLPSDTELWEFREYLLHNVILIHYVVPKDVDLNHYFEVMNSRGEQLEKHEIVKSLLYGTLDSEEARQTFSRIWDACAHMGSYIQQFLGDSPVFADNSASLAAKSFDEISLPDTLLQRESILKMMHCAADRIDSEPSADYDEKFLPIIDFPNFLLIALKITLFLDGKLNIRTFQLDDKELLREFNEYLAIYKSEGREQEFVRKFAYNLLKSKYFLDNFVVHHSLRQQEEEGQNPWELEIYSKEGNETILKNLTDGNIQTELVHLLSMFETAFTPKTRKNYLFYVLAHLFSNQNVKDYLKFLQGLAAKYFYDIYLCRDCLNERNMPRPDIFDSLIIGGGTLCLDIVNTPAPTALTFEEVYPLGNANISLFVFNFTDYKLWKKYASAVRGEGLRDTSHERKAFFDELGCKDFGLDTFNRFYFSRTRKSLEHFYPQANSLPREIPNDETPTEKEINCFGNFAMIGADANSSGSNWSPAAKCDHYNSRKLNKVSVASLKFKIMMQKCEDNLRNQSGPINKETAWLYKDIREHQQKMLAIILDME